MNIFKLVVLSFLVLVSFTHSNSGKLPPVLVIPNASYAIEEGRMVKFYTFDGNLIQALDQWQCSQKGYYDIQMRSLDSNAPKPQPTAYKIVYRNTFKSPAGYWMIFYDKNGNTIYKDRCNSAYSTLPTNSKLDLSIVRKVD